VNPETKHDSYPARINAVKALLNQRQIDEAATQCEAIVGLDPKRVEPLLLLARVRQQQGRLDDMLEVCETAIRLNPGHRGAELLLVEACIYCSRHDRAKEQLAVLEAEATEGPALLQHIAQLYAHMGCHREAHGCYRLAASLLPDDAEALYNLASSQVAIGELEKAEASFCAVLAVNPGDCDAWHNRSLLRKQTADDNHITALYERLAGLGESDRGAIALLYALAKEYEDLGEFDKAFECLAEGARNRRARLTYRVGNDESIMRQIAETFDAGYAGSQRDGDDREGPVFVLGLPRSGTTLVDRILSSHSQVTSLGEINDFALCLTRLGKVAEKHSLLEAAAELSPKALGSLYLDGVATYGYDSRLFIDKTPANYLYVGLIAKALPRARIVSLKRHPIDSCLAMFRTLFRMGYPFSYDLDDLGRYYIAYDKLMHHWESILPGRIHYVSYEQMVDDQETVSRDLLRHCGLPWEDGVLQFEQNAAPVATASAAQVRQPIYRDALSRWRRYEKQLAPLIRQLDAAGIAL